jgi:hypothetical protein
MYFCNRIGADVWKKNFTSSCNQHLWVTLRFRPHAFSTQALVQEGKKLHVSCMLETSWHFQSKVFQWDLVCMSSNDCYALRLARQHQDEPGIAKSNTKTEGERILRRNCSKLLNCTYGFYTRCCFHALSFRHVYMKLPRRKLELSHVLLRRGTSLNVRLSQFSSLLWTYLHLFNTLLFLAHPGKAHVADRFR